MVHHLVEKVWLHRVQHIEEILSRRTSSCREHIREELGDLGVVGELRPEGLHRELIVVRNFDEDDLILLQ